MACRKLSWDYTRSSMGNHARACRASKDAKKDGTCISNIFSDDAEHKNSIQYEFPHETRLVELAHLDEQH